MTRRLPVVRVFILAWSFLALSSSPTRFVALGFVAPKSLSSRPTGSVIAPTTQNDNVFAPSPSSSSSSTSLSAIFALGSNSKKKKKKKKKRQRRYNPLWPNGLDKEDIDDLVENILADETINIPSIPDVIERKIYRSTIVLTLNAVYRGIGWIHGKTLLGHEFSVTKMKRDESRSARMRKKALLTMKSDVDEELLEEVADRLLANKAVNQAMVPDVLERAVYISCLKIVFRILNMLAASFRITFCGHDITLTLEKAVTRLQVLNAAQEAASSATPIDTAVLRALARDAAVDSEEEALGIKDRNGDDGGDDSLWDKGKSLIKSSQDEFIIQLHSVLYCLILGILDDLLANTELVLMSDRIQFDIVTKKPKKVKAADDDDDDDDDDDEEAVEQAEAIDEMLDEVVLEQEPKSAVITNEDEDDDDKVAVAKREDGNEKETTTPKKRRVSRVLTFIAGVALGVGGATLRSVV